LHRLVRLREHRLMTARVGQLGGQLPIVAGGRVQHLVNLLQARHFLGRCRPTRLGAAREESEASGQSYESRRAHLRSLRTPYSVPGPRSVVGEDFAAGPRPHRLPGGEVDIVANQPYRAVGHANVHTPGMIAAGRNVEMDNGRVSAVVTLDPFGYLPVPVGGKRVGVERGAPQVAVKLKAGVGDRRS